MHINIQKNDKFHLHFCGHKTNYHKADFNDRNHCYFQIIPTQEYVTYTGS